MAYRIPNKNPIDIGSRVAIGVSIPFNQPAVFNQTYTTNDQIKSNLINYVLTNRGERPLNPNFGLSLQEKLFENITPVSTTALQTYIIDGITANIPLITNLDVTIDPQPDSNSVNITIKYSYLGNQNTVNIEL